MERKEERADEVGQQRPVGPCLADEERRELLRQVALAEAERRSSQQREAALADQLLASEAELAMKQASLATAEAERDNLRERAERAERTLNKSPGALSRRLTDRLRLAKRRFLRERG